MGEFFDTYKTPTHICVIIIVMHEVMWLVVDDKTYLITWCVICCWNIVIDNCMICGLCELLKRRRHYELCDLLC